MTALVPHVPMWKRLSAYGNIRKSFWHNSSVLDFHYARPLCWENSLFGWRQKAEFILISYNILKVISRTSRLVSINSLY